MKADRVLTSVFNCIQINIKNSSSAQAHYSSKHFHRTIFFPPYHVKQHMWCSTNFLTGSCWGASYLDQHPVHLSKTSFSSQHIFPSSFSWLEYSKGKRPLCRGEAVHREMAMWHHSLTSRGKRVRRHGMRHKFPVMRNYLAHNSKRILQYCLHSTFFSGAVAELEVNRLNCRRSPQDQWLYGNTDVTPVPDLLRSCSLHLYDVRISNSGLQDNAFLG